jgi:hypothetical protein
VINPIRADQTSALEAPVTAIPAFPGAEGFGTTTPGGRGATVGERIVDDTQYGTGGLIDHPADVGGWPEHDSGILCADADYDGMADDWEGLKHLDPNNAFDNNANANSDGYTNLEEFLNGTNPNRP